MDAMGELELYLHKNTDIPFLVSCALVHYQFETIHPFLDGNGRLGRLLITFYLYWKKALQYPTLYLSYYFKIHRQEYYDRLNLVRDKGDYEQWVTFFLKGAEEAKDRVEEIINAESGSLQNQIRQLEREIATNTAELNRIRRENEVLAQTRETHLRQLTQVRIDVENQFNIEIKTLKMVLVAAVIVIIGAGFKFYR